jgi:16S rRNA (cytidine1402-2'-O)-methyltransferase
MSLIVVSVPIGNYGDITLRAIETLKEAEAVICEEMRPARVLLKRIGIDEKALFQLNEHSRSADLEDLLDLCRTKKTALISDCGTPGFCDPGAKLVAACRKENISIDVNPGPSSLMALLSLSGAEFSEFHFVGFLPAEKQARAQRLERFKNVKIPLVFMDTPYRLDATVKELAALWPERTAVLGIDLTGSAHQLAHGKLRELAKTAWSKQPFVLLVL